MFQKIKNIIKSKSFYKKLGQSFAEYAIILALLGLILGFGTKELYEASKHNFYYGLLPTNQQNIDLPEGPAGQHGFFQEGYLGKIELVCEIDDKELKVDSNGKEYYEYHAEAGQTVFCYDNSINAVRNNWSSKYKEFTLSYGQEETLNLTIWDEYGIKYSTYAVITTITRTGGAGGNATKPISNIILNPNLTRYGMGSLINASAAASKGVGSHPIEEYEWKIADVYMGYAKEGDTTKVKLTKVEGLPGTSDAENVTIKVIESEDIDSRERGLTTEISYIPKANRYIRLRVKSNGIWSDWTQKAIYASDNSVPVAIISTNIASAEKDKMTVYTEEPFLLLSSDSYDPDALYVGESGSEEDLLNQTTYGKGITAFQWRLYQKNTSGQYILIKEYDMNKDVSELGTNYYTFLTPGEYCFTLRVQDTENVWSNWLDPNITNETKDAIKYVRVYKPNQAPDIGPSTYTVPASNANHEITIEVKNQTRIVVTPQVIHPETSEANYQNNYKPEDYTFGEFYWVLLKDDGTESVYREIDSGERYVQGSLTLPVLEAGKYILKIQVKDKSDMWSDEDDTHAIYHITVKKDMTPQYFAYSNGIQTTVLDPGTYKLEVWGAQGGKSSHGTAGGKGGYTTATFTTNTTVTVYVVVGGRGGAQLGGYNGGGNGHSRNQDSAGGGGATHIALETGILSSLSAKRDKILVVAGGGGGAGCTGTTGGYGGGTTGGNGNGSSYAPGKGASQTEGGANGGHSENGSFGKGGNTGTAYDWPGAGGGGGYFGGGAGANLSGGGGSAGGGSGYVKPGLTGSTTGGNQSFVSINGTSNETGHANDGYAKITPIE